MTTDLAGVDRINKLRHRVKHRVHIFRAVLGAVVKSIAPGRPQRYMEHGPVFSVVDVFAGEHARAEIFHAGLARQPLA